MAKKNKRPSPAVSISNLSQQKFEFNPDYSHTKRDLARIGVLAGFFFAGLIVLSFFIK
jgi:hypothetical protein